MPTNLFPGMPESCQRHSLATLDLFDKQWYICGNMCLFFHTWHRYTLEGLDTSLIAARFARGLPESFSSNSGQYIKSIDTTVVICAFCFKFSTDVLLRDLIPPKLPPWLPEACQSHPLATLDHIWWAKTHKCSSVANCAYLSYQTWHRCALKGLDTL